MLEGLQQVLRDGKARYLSFICLGNDGYQIQQLLDTNVFHMIPLCVLTSSSVSAMLSGNVSGINLGDRRFDPICEIAEADGLPLAVHPQTGHDG